MKLDFGPRRGIYLDISSDIESKDLPLRENEAACYEKLDLIYRTLCSILYNFVPLSGHPGGSISSGRIVASLIFDIMAYDFSFPDRHDADIVSYAAGHKALGLYAMWALRNEIARTGAPELLPADIANQLRFEDLLGFRRNASTETPLFKKYRSKSLDGHPTPAIPFVALATGASGVGVASSIGLALGAADYYGVNAPRIHIIEGEGGLTPGRVSEALAAAATAGLSNVFLHIDWNQSSIDSQQVCRDNDTPGDYVQWNPCELAYLHDWNVIYVPDGTDMQQIMRAQRAALQCSNGQPTALVYRTVKGWRYGIEGRKAHGAGHALCSSGFMETLSPLFDRESVHRMICENKNRCKSGHDPAIVEHCFWNILSQMRTAIQSDTAMVETFSARLGQAQKKLDTLKRKARPNAPSIEKVYTYIDKNRTQIPDEFTLPAGTATTLRQELARVLCKLNTESNGALLVAAADLLASTSVNGIADDFPHGFFDFRSNKDSRIVSVGGICEDAMAALMCGVSTMNTHIGVCSSYAAFIAALSHIPARLHAIGNQARHARVFNEPYRPCIVVCAHAGLKTGEDGPTHADPQPLQLVQENFPRKTAITLTPWDPQELWPLLIEALKHRPAVIFPFVTRPAETVVDREKTGLAPAADAVNGIYRLCGTGAAGDTVVVLQGSGVAYEFVTVTLPLLRKSGMEVTAYYIASSELFDLLPPEKQQAVFPEPVAQKAIGITGFTLPTLYRWVRSDKGRIHSLHAFKHQHYPGSGTAAMVLQEAGLDGENQYKTICAYIGK